MEVHSLEKHDSCNCSVVHEGECFVASLEVSHDVGATMEVVGLVFDERAKVSTNSVPNKLDLKENEMVTSGVWDDIEQLVKKACSDFQDVPGSTNSQLLVANSYNDVKNKLHFTGTQNLIPQKHGYFFESSEGEKSKQAANAKKSSRRKSEKTKIKRTRQLIDVEACRKPFELGFYIFKDGSERLCIVPAQKTTLIENQQDSLTSTTLLPVDKDLYCTVTKIYYFV
ncbi:uncharacterized protein LOC143225625 isoform X3 [Tachypleus tridentatus]|uniref:uncharacterized protein LOC143225625 isoform X3 n=1 Tax=Tachypleus tridentatus TaxID=6853 RepID=UPI003FD2E580